MLWKDHSWADKSGTEEEDRTGTCVTQIIGYTPAIKLIKDLQLNLVSLGKEAVLVQEFYIQLNGYSCANEVRTITQSRPGPASRLQENSAGTRQSPLLCYPK